MSYLYSLNYLFKLIEPTMHASNQTYKIYTKKIRRIKHLISWKNFSKILTYNIELLLIVYCHRVTRRQHSKVILFHYQIPFCMLQFKNGARRNKKSPLFYVRNKVTPLGLDQRFYINPHRNPNWKIGFGRIKISFFHVRMC